MAYTTRTDITPGGSGNYSPLTLYYWADMDLVNSQLPPDGSGQVGFLNVIFYGPEEPHEITVYAARDGNNNLLQYVALPWGPYFIEEDESYGPLNYIPKAP